MMYTKGRIARQIRWRVCRDTEYVMILHQLWRTESESQQCVSQSENHSSCVGQSVGGPDCMGTHGSALRSCKYCQLCQVGPLGNDQRIITPFKACSS